MMHDSRDKHDPDEVRGPASAEHILTVTMNPAVDKSARVTDVVSERKLRCQDPRREPGGGGINVSRAIHKLGGRSTALFPVGGPVGEMLKQLLDAEGIQRQSINSQAWTRENLTIFEQSTEEQYRFGMPGPKLAESEWADCLTRCTKDPQPAFIVGSGSLPPGVPDDFYAQLAKAAHQAGARFLLDTSGEPLKRGAQAGVYLLKPNAREFQTLTDAPFESEQQQERLARKLVDDGRCEVLILSLGAAGVLLVTPDAAQRLRSPSVPIRSKVGAGDSMMAAITLGLARGMNIRAATCYGIAAGAAAVMTPGSELCRRSDVEELQQRLAGCELPN